MRASTSFMTRLDPVTAYAYLADFGTIAEWDPFIARCERLDGPGPRVGARYRAHGRFLGRSLVLDYVTEALEPPRRIRLRGSSGRAFRGWDEIRIEPARGGGSHMTYEAEIGLRGAARLLWVLAPMALLVMKLRNRGGPMDGMRRRLDELAARP